MDISHEVFERARAFKHGKGYEKFFKNISGLYPICVFGAGLLGKQIASWLLDNGIQPKCFCDNDPALHGKEIVVGIPCIPFDELLALKDEIYVIVGIGDKVANETVNAQLKEFCHILRNPLGLTVYWGQTFDIGEEKFSEGIQYVLDHVADTASKELFELLVELRMQDHIIDYPVDTMEKYFCKGPYIVRDLVDYSKITTYIDCGAYVGDSLADFINLAVGAEYHCFEMDQDVFEILKRNASQYEKEKIYLYPYGVGANKETVKYCPDSTGGSKISEYGAKISRTVSLDSVHFDKKIDFIKMDIEGAEENAIEGAKKLIKGDHPILAISIYHNFSQFVNVIRMIKQLDSQYQIYIRQHKYTLDDTVCYAIYEQPDTAGRAY